MRFIAFIIGVVVIIFGLVMFIRAGVSERELAAKLQSIQEGKIQPESLTVVRKYVSASLSSRGPGRGFPHVVLKSRETPKINLSTTREFYDSVNTNSPVNGYHFPDGYFVPESIGPGPGVAKWGFLGVGLVVGGGFLALGLTSGKAGPGEGDSYPRNPSLRDVLTVARNRRRRE
jgi:hypothetical protein